MKKFICLLLAMLVVVSAVGCAETAQEDSETKEVDYTNVDLDLSAMSFTMAYSSAQNVEANPTAYQGKSIRVTGTFYVVENESLNCRYYEVYIMDTTACCYSFFEFSPWEDLSYPADFPEQGTEITVTGIYDTYTAEDGTWWQLRDAVLEIPNE